MQGGYLLDLIILKAHISGDFYEDCSRDARQETLAQNPYNTSPELSPEAFLPGGRSVAYGTSRLPTMQMKLRRTNGSIVDTGRWNPHMKIKGTHFLVAEEVHAGDEDALH